MDRGWRATVHRGAKSWTRLKGLNTHVHVPNLSGCLLSPLWNGATIANHRFFSMRTEQENDCSTTDTELGSGKN